MLPKSQFPGHHRAMPYFWLSEALDLAQMVMDIPTQVQITIFIIPNNFCFNNIAKKSVPGTPRGHALLLAVRGSYPDQVRKSGPPPILAWSVDQELSFDTLTLSLLSKLSDSGFFLFFFTYSNYNIDRCSMCSLCALWPSQKHSITLLLNKLILKLNFPNVYKAF